MKHVDESVLVEALKLGKPEAVKQWFKLYHDQVFSLVESRISLSQDAEEVTQEVFINSLRQLAFFRGNSSLKTWMFSIAKHEIADYYRKKYAKKALKTLPLQEITITLNTDASDIHQNVLYILSKMSTYTAELLQKKYIDGKKVQDIAAECSKTVKAIESELYRAREEFKLLWRAEFGTEIRL